MSHELLPKLQNELRSLRSRIEREQRALVEVAGDSSALNAARRRLKGLTLERNKLEYTERMLLSQAHGG